MPTRIADTSRSIAVPVDLAGKPVAWNRAHTCVVAHAETLQQFWHAVHEAKIDDPVFEKVPHADVRFVRMR